MKQYVGIPFAEKNCWELCCDVYAKEYGIELPRMGHTRHLRITDLTSPTEGCLVHVVRQQPLSEHWGVHIGGYVLHAQQPASVMVPLNRFLQHHSDVRFLEVRAA